MSLRCAIFDMDDVLCAYDVNLRIATLAAMAGRSCEAVSAALWQTDFFDEADRGAFSATDYLAEFGRRLGTPLSRAEWITARKVAMRPFADSLTIVRRLKARMPVALLTNNDQLVAETLAELFPALPPLFAPHLYVSASLGIAKPDPACFLRVCELLNVAPHEAFFTDDRQDNVEGARRAGLIAHQFTSPPGLAAALAALGHPDLLPL